MTQEDAEELKFVGYTRPTQYVGSPEQALALADAYAGFQALCLVNMVLSVMMWAFIALTDGRNIDAVLVAGSILIALVTGYMSYRPARSYNNGLNRPPGRAIATCIVLALQSWLCFGMFGYAVVSNRVAEELKKYGVKIGFLGVRKQDMQQLLHRMTFSEIAPAPFDPSDPPS